MDYQINPETKGRLAESKHNRMPVQVPEGTAKAVTQDRPVGAAKSESCKKSKDLGSIRSEANNGSPGETKINAFDGLLQSVIGVPSCLPESTRGQVLVSLGFPHSILKMLHKTIATDKFVTKFEELCKTEYAAEGNTTNRSIASDNMEVSGGGDALQDGTGDKAAGSEVDTNAESATVCNGKVNDAGTSSAANDDGSKQAAADGSNTGASKATVDGGTNGGGDDTRRSRRSSRRRSGENAPDASAKETSVLDNDDGGQHSEGGKSETTKDDVEKEVRLKYVYYCSKPENSDVNLVVKTRAQERQLAQKKGESVLFVKYKNHSWMPDLMQHAFSELQGFVGKALRSFFPVMTIEPFADWDSYKKADEKERLSAKEVVEKYSAYESVEGMPVSADAAAAKLKENKDMQLTGWLDRGDHSSLELTPCIAQTVNASEQPVHIDDKLALRRAAILKEKGTLVEESFKVGYLMIVPLMAEGAGISLKLEVEEGKSVRYDFRIPFGSALFLRMDVYHNGCYGSDGSWRLLCPVTTSKTPCLEFGHNMPQPILDKVEWGFAYNEPSAAMKVNKFYDKKTKITYLGDNVVPFHKSGIPRMESYHFIPCTGYKNQHPENNLREYWQAMILNPSEADVILKFLGFKLLMENKGWQEWWLRHSKSRCQNIADAWKHADTYGNRRKYRYSIHVEQVSEEDFHSCNEEGIDNDNGPATSQGKDNDKVAGSTSVTPKAKQAPVSSQSKESDKDVDAGGDSQKPAAQDDKPAAGPKRKGKGNGKATAQDGKPAAGPKRKGKGKGKAKSKGKGRKRKQREDDNNEDEDATTTLPQKALTGNWEDYSKDGEITEYWQSEFVKSRIPRSKGGCEVFPVVPPKLRENLMDHGRITLQQGFLMALVFLYIHEMSNREQRNIGSTFEESWVDIDPIMNAQCTELYEATKKAAKKAKEVVNEGVSEKRIENAKKRRLLRHPYSLTDPLYVFLDKKEEDEKPHGLDKKDDEKKPAAQDKKPGESEAPTYELEQQHTTKAV